MSNFIVLAFGNAKIVQIAGATASLTQAPADPRGGTGLISPGG
jgi:hypothetical protein